jgi:phosphonate transport system substrate-binding protein
MKKLRIIFIMSLMVLTAGMALAKDSFVIGVAPHTSARVILEMYQPLQKYLEKTLGMPVEIATATDFDTFARRGLANEFDMAITTGHQARLFQTEAKYIPLLTYKADFKAVALVASNSPVQKTAELKGKPVLGLAPTSLVTLWGMHWLKTNKVDTATIKHVSASDSVAQLIISGEATAGFMSLANYEKLTPAVRGQLRIFAESKTMAGRVYVLNKRNAALQKKIDAALWAFAGTPEAKTYFENNKLEGYRKLRANELKEMDSFAGEVRKVLSNTTK